MQQAWSTGVSYFKEIRRFPMLKAEEEQLLVARWREIGDEDAAHKLLTSHLRIVAKIASYRGYGFRPPI
jgi:RNA polymerase sigma-32 factor